MTMLFTEVPTSAKPADFIAKGIDEVTAHHMARDLKTQRCFINVLYQVVVAKVKAPFGSDAGDPGDMLWLSIKRRDRNPIHDWRELQEIKNAIVGPECEAFELYPAESRLVDTANQYHLFAFTDPTVRMPVGWTYGRNVTGPDEAMAMGAVQREFKE